MTLADISLKTLAGIFHMLMVLFDLWYSRAKGRIEADVQYWSKFLPKFFFTCTCWIYELLNETKIIFPIDKILHRYLLCTELTSTFLLQVSYPLCLLQYKHIPLYLEWAPMDIFGTKTNDETKETKEEKNKKSKTEQMDSREKAHEVKDREEEDTKVSVGS